MEELCEFDEKPEVLLPKMYTMHHKHGTCDMVNRKWGKATGVWSRVRVVWILFFYKHPNLPLDGPMSCQIHQFEYQCRPIPIIYDSISPTYQKSTFFWLMIIFDLRHISHHSHITSLNNVFLIRTISIIKNSNNIPSWLSNNNMCTTKNTISPKKLSK